MRIAMTILAATLVSQVSFGRQGGLGLPAAQTLYPPDGTYGIFGRHLKVDGDALLVGSWMDLPSQTTGKAVSVFERTGMTWTQTATLAPPIPAFYFGTTFDVRGDRALVGAATFNFVGGAVYLYERGPGGWILSQTLVIPGALGVGGAVALGDGYAFTINSTGGVQGVSVFEESPAGWTLQPTTLIPSDGPGPNGFGSVMDATEDELFVGAPLMTTTFPEDGAAYVFELQGGNWVEVQKVIPALALEYEHFANDLDVDGDVLAIGSNRYGASGNHRAYAFRRDPAGWTQEAVLTQVDAEPYAGFGWSVAAFKDRIMVGAPQHQYDGAAYVFERRGGTWGSLALLEPAAAGLSQQAGWDVEFDSFGSALVGMRFDYTAPAPSFGSVTNFDLTRGVRYCSATANSTGEEARIDVQGSLSVAGNDLRIRVGPIPPQQPGILYYGAGQTLIPFGNGFRCISGVAGTYRVYPFVTPDTYGLFTRELDLTTAPMSNGPGQILPGSTWSVQAWFRDPAAGGAGFNLSDAVALAFLP